MFIVKEDAKSVSAESYRMVRTNIQYCSYDDRIRSIMVTSSNPGEGKSTFIGNLAITMAQEDKKVLLIDCDMRKPRAHKNFGLSNLKGLSEVLIGKVNYKDAVQKYSDNLYVLTSGKTPPNPSEMLSSKGMENLIQEVDKEYDMVLIDTPPVRYVTDAQILSTKTDGTIFVIRSGRTKREEVIESKLLLDKVGAKILGPVLVGVDKREGYYYYDEDHNKKKKRFFNKK